MKTLNLTDKEQAMLFTALTDMTVKASAHNNEYIIADYTFSRDEIVDLARKIQCL